MPSFHPGLSETEPALSADALSGRSAFFLPLASISWPRMDFSRRSTTRLKCDDPLCQLVDGERGGVDASRIIPAFFLQITSISGN